MKSNEAWITLASLASDSVQRSNLSCQLNKKLHHLRSIGNSQAGDENDN